jgi:hypothetical protein
MRAAGLYLNARSGCRLNLIMLVIKIKKLKAKNIARASDSLEVVEAEFLLQL